MFNKRESENMETATPATREATALQQFAPSENATVIGPARLAKLEAKAPQNYPPLGSVTKPNLTTAELAYYSNMAEQTWRVKACYDTAPEGLRPLRVCGKLAWPTAGAKKLLGVA